MSNPCLEAAEDELTKAGVPYRVETGGKHLHVKYGDDYSHLFVVSASPSDTRRGTLNVRTDLRRLLKEQGLVSVDVEPEASSPIVQIANGEPVCASHDISAQFGKAHKDVLRAIDRVREECGPEFDRRNFTPIDYLDPKGRKYRAFQMSRDGFSLVVMGFTGAAATAWKVRYIDAFNTMAGELQRLADRAPDLSGIRAEFDALVSLVGEVEAKVALPPPIVERTISRNTERREMRRLMRRYAWRMSA